MELTIYELIELIKNGIAPFEITYQGEKYYVDKLENYYRAENGTSLFENIFDNYNDYDALQQKVRIPEENDEWEDIEEIDKGNYEFTTLDLKKKVNQLIKNQKYLKEKLEEK